MKVQSDHHQILHSKFQSSQKRVEIKFNVLFYRFLLLQWFYMVGFCSLKNNILYGSSQISMKFDKLVHYFSITFFTTGSSVQENKKLGSFTVVAKSYAS
jgi:hypothetical protein